MRVRIQFVILRRQPKSPIGIKDFYTERGEKLFKYASSINTSPGKVRGVNFRLTECIEAGKEKKLTPPGQTDPRTESPQAPSN